ncbi:MAG: TIGR01777 family protein [Myxococcales bacterium]|nr:TIGR01777 family protein [Myxococcales bacterium]
MKLLLTGATGFVGRALCLRLLRDGHELHAVVRDVAAARAVLGEDVRLVAWRDGDGLAAMVAACDGVIHLAGEPIVGKRWHAARKEALRHSRLDTAKTLALYAARREAPLHVVIGASAIGYYGDRGDETLSETSAAGPSDDFAAKLCADWEQASLDIPARRHVITRVGLVLGADGGLLATMTPTFKLGLGAVLAGGEAWQAWIHLNDLVEIFARAVADSGFAGVYNATAPNPVTNREFSEALAARYGKRARLGAPRWVLRGALGEAAGLVLASTKAMPVALTAQGFRFAFTDVRAALADLINANASAV